MLIETTMESVTIVRSNLIHTVGHNDKHLSKKLILFITATTDCQYIRDEDQNCIGYGCHLIRQHDYGMT